MGEKAPSASMLLRIIILMLCCGIILFIPLGMRLFKLQITEYEFYKQKAVDQQTRDMTVSARRGGIYDRNMVSLAVSATVETVYLSPPDFKDDAEREKISRGLSDLLEVDYNTILKRAGNKSKAEIVKKKVEQEEADAVRAFIVETGTKAVYLGVDTKRYYPYGNMASALLGFCNMDNEGQYGIESFYDSYMKGLPGRIIYARNAKGREMDFKYEQFYDPEDGRGVVLTIDKNIQAILDRHLTTAYIDNMCNNKTAGIVMNVKTGDILAMSTIPDYDLNDPRKIEDLKLLAQMEAKIASGDEKDKAQLDALFSMWRNKPIQDTYEPGSTFKIITASIGLEEGVVSLNDHFFCSGSRTVGGHNIHCWKRGGHGAEDFLDGLQNSCNPVFMEVGLRIGPERYYDYLTAFGFREKTRVDLPGEAKSILHSKESFNEVELATTSFGQTFKITPLQLISAACAVVNGGKYMKPHIVSAYTDKDGNITERVEPEMVRQVVSAETSATMRMMMEAVVAGGTGKNAYVRGYRVGGKTGTSEKRDDPDPTKRIASFIGVAPMDDPQIAVLVILDEPQGALRQGGQIAAPVAGRILADLLPYLGIEPKYSEEDMKDLERVVPEVVNVDIKNAQYMVSAAKLKYKTVGSGSKVISQIPVSGVSIPGSAEVILYTDDSKPLTPVKVPRLVGMNPEQADRALAAAGLYPNFRGVLKSNGSGSLSVTLQEPAEGTEVPPGSIVVVELGDLVSTIEE